MTLEEARQSVTDNLFDGTICPCCDQYARVYRRQIHSTMTRELITFYRYAGNDWAYLPNAGVQRGGDMVKVRYWGLIEEDNEQRDDGSPRTGWWRITSLGCEFLERKTTVPKYAHVYNGDLITLDGPEVMIEDTLGKKFSYYELMSG